MSQRDDLETFAAGAPRAVDVAGIERELLRMWQSAGASDEGRGVMRASLFNLIVCAPAGGEAAASASVATVCAEMPCRALVIVPHEDAAGAPDLEAYISAHCQPALGDRKQVCCEQVTIRAARRALDSVPSTILALLVPDLPSVLWWPGDPDLEGGFLVRLSHYLEQLVVDSAGFAAPEARLLQLQRLRSDQPALQVADLEWERLDPWRELLAALFDPPQCRALLNQVRRVRLAYAPPNPAQALLYAGWLVSRLGWQPRERLGLCWKLASGSARIELAIESGGAAGRSELLQADVECEGGSRFSVRPDADHPQLLVAHRDGTGSSGLLRQAPRNRLDPDIELARRLLRTSRSPAHEAALGAAAQLLQTGVAPGDPFGR